MPPSQPIPKPTNSTPGLVGQQPQPIIYQSGKPNFENSNNPKNSWDFSLVKQLLELNAGLLLLIFLVLAGFIGMNLFSQPKNPATAASTTNTEQAAVSNQQPKIAAAAQKSPVYINEQVISIDKAFNSNPSQIKLTLNGAIKKEVFGYLPYWVTDKLDQIDTKLLTSVAYFGLEVGPDGDIIKNYPQNPQISEAWNRWQNDKSLITFLRKQKANRVKVFLTFKSFSNDNIEKMVKNPQAQTTFINNVLYQISSKSLDGVNIDFEYVGTPPDEVRDKFSILMSNLNKEMKRQYPKSVLTIATYARSAKVNEFFDVSLLAQNSDGLVIMGYDFHTPDSANAGAVAPMGGEGINLLDYINAYLEKVPPEKLILAVPYYGYDWPAITRRSDAQVAQGEVKVLPYGEIAELSQKLNIQWNETTQTPWYTYFSGGQNRVVHFENTRSLGVKYDFINKKNLAGVGIWALGFDGRTTELEQLLADKFAN